MVPPDGALCGSSLITDRYAAGLRMKLEAERPNLSSGTNIEATATALANDWDLIDKPRIDIYKRKYMRRKIYTSGGVKIQWSREEILALFEPSLKGVADLLENQLELASVKGLTVSKLIVVGGFGESPSLRGRIEEVIGGKRNLIGTTIDTIWPHEFPTSAVARGAVLRALNKSDGPSRISRSSFGFLRHEQYLEYTEHIEAGVKPARDPVDHYDSVYDTIWWVIQAGTELPTRFETEAIKSCHYFPRDEDRLICVERLYSSPRKHRSHFQNHHPENEGKHSAFLLSYIEVNVSEFKKEFPEVDKATAGPRMRVSNRKIRVVQFDLVIIVEGRQLKYEARWPSGAPSPEAVRIRKQGYVSLAPSFVPGTE
ncbi:uncharacterized protein A1O9_08578 [Exophiala aquamarina CBS 119918]|uniref:Uncharacterized protein n=1 Tax=Exophiala aquamarina CBS 119918 TaxID=1182545 RepID=A0A072P7Z1_9EURO|nr:uncharacterized protein A1O9_08578 [Exophiala aquamarina CBS 119918]KEF55827.1 hypothetical protein A1O9_08578 [Exophiala aquamarina CBS 119918]